MGISVGDWLPPLDVGGLFTAFSTFKTIGLFYLGCFGWILYTEWRGH
jgi:hypothetical protein